MSIKEKLIYEAMDQIYREAGLSGRLPMDLVKDLLSRAYDAGKVETPDQDAARWNMFVLQFGEMRARHVRNVAFMPRMMLSFDAPRDLVCNYGAEWRLDCAWTDRTGTADTLPKFIDLMLATRREEK